MQERSAKITGQSQLKLVVGAFLTVFATSAAAQSDMPPMNPLVKEVVQEQKATHESVSQKLNEQAGADELEVVEVPDSELSAEDVQLENRPLESIATVVIEIPAFPSRPKLREPAAATGTSDTEEPALKDVQVQLISK